MAPKRKSSLREQASKRRRVAKDKQNASAKAVPDEGLSKELEAAIMEILRSRKPGSSC